MKLLLEFFYKKFLSKNCIFNSRHVYINYLSRYIKVKQYKTCDTSEEMMEKMAGKFKFVLLIDDESCQGKLFYLPVTISLTNTKMKFEIFFICRKIYRFYQFYAKSRSYQN